MSDLWAPFWRFEAGEMTQKEIADWYTDLINTGYIWKLPNNHLQNAITLLENGVIGSDPKSGGN